MAGAPIEVHTSMLFSMNPESPRHSLVVSVLCTQIVCLLAPVLLSAQPVTDGIATTSRNRAAAGAITGRIFNPATGEYLRNAEIRVTETGQSAASGNEGSFRISPVPPGKATLVVSYTGLGAGRIFAAMAVLHPLAAVVLWATVRREESRNGAH